MTIREKEQIKLSCREAELALRVMDIDKSTEAMKPEEIAAIGHYMKSDVCKKIGLSEILQQELGCQEALEVWAANPGPLYLWDGVSTLWEQLAVEHVWGRFVPSESPWSDFGACSEPACTQLRFYWKRVPFSAFYDGGEEIAGELPLLLGIFLTQKWPLKRLLEIQQKRIHVLSTCLIAGRIPPDDAGHYHKSTDLVREIKENLNCLQKVVKNLLKIQEA